eukprot:jgi/Psemu1/264797/estExt_Genewise1Plus.C_23710001
MTKGVVGETETQSRHSNDLRRHSSFPLGAQNGCNSDVRISTNSAVSKLNGILDETDIETDIETGGNDLNTIKLLTKIAIYRCGTEEGLAALKALYELGENRLPFDFDSFHRRKTSGNNAASNDNDGAGAVDRGEQVISLLPRFLPTETVYQFLELVRHMEDQGWMSTNPDSVDGLPSLHVNLVSQGKPLFSSETNPSFDNDRSDNDKECEEDSFGRQIFKLYDLIRPYVYETLLPTVHRLLKTANIDTHGGRKLRISDVFLRRYGQEICGNVTRNGISIHYDVFSRVTAVVALDEVASKGDNGLFTLTVDERTGETSNHKALRRFFPLRTGDCVVHTWDVLHGVDVEPGLDRTSLIVWFDEVPTDNDGEEKGVEGDQDGTDGNDPISPWLSLEHRNNPADKTTLENGNDVRQFVLASALSSVETNADTELDETLLYLRSAARGNTFALTRMGSICEEGALGSPELQSEAFDILEELRPVEGLPGIVQQLIEDIENPKTELACRFWLEASLSGNPLAQKSLADEIMFEASRSGCPDQRLLAAVLFALASQQDNSEGPSDSLSRVIEYDLASRNVQSQEEFLASPVVQTAKAAFGAV